MMTDKQLIDEYIEFNPAKPGLAEARLVKYGVPVWAIIGYLEAVHQNAGRVADDYDLPLNAVNAAIAYYRAHRTLIDDRIAANAA